MILSSRVAWATQGIMGWDKGKWKEREQTKEKEKKGRWGRAVPKG